MTEVQLDLSIITLSYNTKALTEACIESVVKHTKNLKYELIVVDNASRDGSVEMLKDLKKKLKELVVIFSKENLGFSAGNNLGMSVARGKYILLLNSDTEFGEDAVSPMISWMERHSRVGVATCKLTNTDGSIQATGGMYPDLWHLFLWSTFIDDLPGVGKLFGSYHPNPSFYRKERALDWVTGAFMLIREKAQEEVGEFDPEFFMYAEDVEYCFRFKQKGWRIWYVPIAKITHIGGASSIGEGVRFSDDIYGKESSVVGEFKGVGLFYRKHFPAQYPLALILLRLGAALRFLVFGLMLGQAQAKDIYAKTLKNL